MGDWETKDIYDRISSDEDIYRHFIGIMNKITNDFKAGLLKKYGFTDKEDICVNAQYILKDKAEDYIYSLLGKESPHYWIVGIINAYILEIDFFILAELLIDNTRFDCSGNFNEIELIPDEEWIDDS